MASIVVTLPTLTFSSGATASPSWDVSDAATLTFTAGVSTSPGYSVEVAFQTSSTSFFPLTVPWASNSTVRQQLATVTSSATFSLHGIGFAQLRFTTSAASTGAVTAIGSKSVRT